MIAGIIAGLVLLLAVMGGGPVWWKHHHAALLIGHDKHGFIYRQADGTLRRVPLGNPRMN